MTFPGSGRVITWHSRVRGAMNADLHADNAAELAGKIRREEDAAHDT